MRFPLADWIDDHADCRYNLGSSGMFGTVLLPRPSAAAIRSADAEELRRGLGVLVGVDPSRLFLTHGATEANSAAVFYLRRAHSTRSPRFRVRLPEYPPLSQLPLLAGFRPVTRSGPADLAVVSQPRNPEGDLWPVERLLRWAEGARATLVDETFREFSEAPSLQRHPLPGLWTTGTFTKVYGGDDLRVGFVVPPEEETERFARFHGVVTDEIPVHSVAGALAVLAHRERILRAVRSQISHHQSLWRRANPGGPPLAGPVAFDDPVAPDGDRFARRCLRSSVLVCPGSFFGRRSGVRVGFTRRSFPRDLARYLRVRAAVG